MIQLSVAPAISVPASLRPALLAAGSVPGFALALAAQSLPGEKDAAVPEPGGEGTAADAVIRQALAVGGKELPVAGVDSHGDEDSGDDEAAAAPFAWFAVPVIADPAPAARALPLPAPRIAAAADAPACAAEVAPGEIVAAPLPGGEAADPAAPVAPAAAASVPIAATAPKRDGKAAPAIPIVTDAPPAATVEATPKIATHEIAATVAARLSEPGRETSAPIRTLPKAAPALPDFQPTRIVPVPAASLLPELVQPLATALIAEAAPVRRTAPRDPAPLPAPAPLGFEPVRTTAVAAAPEAQPPALDMRGQQWMATMIERIEGLRETPGSRETSIRLSPDALGMLDIAITQEGDRIHVRFTAETPAARALLVEAQPRLAELAEARGLRLGQASVDTAAGQGGQRHEPGQRAHSFPSAPPSARADTDPATDQRIA